MFGSLGLLADDLSVFLDIGYPRLETAFADMIPMMERMRLTDITPDANPFRSLLRVRDDVSTDIFVLERHIVIESLKTEFIDVMRGRLDASTSLGLSKITLTLLNLLKQNFAREYQAIPIDSDENDGGAGDGGYRRPYISDYRMDTRVYDAIHEVYRAHSGPLAFKVTLRTFQRADHV
jgi:hypothetical protein